MNELRHQAASGKLAQGTHVRITRTFTEEDVQRFGRITRDYNPVHYDPRWCASKGYSGIVCHGLLVSSMVCEPGGQWGWLATGMSFRFRKPVYIGDTVSCEITIAAIDEHQRARADCVFLNQHGEIVLTGELFGYLPNQNEQQQLGQMLAEGDPTNELQG